MAKIVFDCLYELGSSCHGCSQPSSLILFSTAFPSFALCNDKKCSCFKVNLFIFHIQFFCFSECIEYFASLPGRSQSLSYTSLKVEWESFWQYYDFGMVDRYIRLSVSHCKRNSIWFAYSSSSFGKLVFKLNVYLEKCSFRWNFANC